MLTRFGQTDSDNYLNNVFSGYDAAGGRSITTATTVAIDTEHFASSGTYTLASGEVTINEVGTYEVNAGVTIQSTSGARTQVQMWVERNGVEIPGTRMMAYCRQASHGASGSAQFCLDLNQGDVIRIRAQRTAGSGVVQSLANGSRLTLRKL